MAIDLAEVTGSAAKIEEGNKNSLEDSQSEVNVMHITLPKYA